MEKKQMRIRDVDIFSWSHIFKIGLRDEKMQKRKQKDNGR
jgi:hypothetical protein